MISAKIIIIFVRMKVSVNQHVKFGSAGQNTAYHAADQQDHWDVG